MHWKEITVLCGGHGVSCGFTNSTSYILYKFTCITITVHLFICFCYYMELFLPGIWHCCYCWLFSFSFFLLWTFRKLTAAYTCPNTSAKSPVTKQCPFTPCWLPQSYLCLFSPPTFVGGTLAVISGTNWLGFNSLFGTPDSLCLKYVWSHSSGSESGGKSTEVKHVFRGS